MFTILAVDDKMQNLFTLKALLEDFKDIEFLEATSGEDALTSVLNNDVNLILLDIQMPGMDGFEVAKFLKFKQSTKDIPIIFLTAVFKSDEFISHGYEVGAVDYLTKPIDDNLLINKIKLYRSLYEKNKELIGHMKKRFEQEKMLKEQEKLMIQQSKMAEMGEMIGNIAHQWRQPLNALSLKIVTLDKKNRNKTIDEEFVLEFVQKSTNIINKMSDTIDDFRNFFKPDKQKEIFNLHDAVNDTITFIQDSLHNKKIEISLIGEQNCEMFGFKNEFSQVLLNIINNSKDAIILNNIQNGKIDIKLLSDENEFQVIIEDNGGGIDEDIIHRIYEPYFTTKHKADGTGIGMYMSKMIIENSMNGRIEMSNIPGGTQTIIYLKREK